jgi:hypothetical protein
MNDIIKKRLLKRNKKKMYNSIIQLSFNIKNNTFIKKKYNLNNKIKQLNINNKSI